MTRVSHRAGHSLVELVVASGVGGVFLALLAALLTAETRLARTTAEQAARQDAIRVAWSVLSAELRYLVPGRDVQTGAGDSVQLRAIRGVLLPCSTAGIYRYHGMREPDAAKDSLVGAASGQVLPVGLSAAAADACGPGSPDPLVRLTAGAALELGEPLLLYESGAYHLQARALRYRLGAEGRQPLTGEWFDDVGSALLPAASSERSLVLSLRLAPRRLATTHAAAAREVLLHFRSLNGAPPPEPAP